MFAFNMLAKRHLQECQAHVQSLNYVALPRQGVVAPGTLPPGHLGLDVLKSHQHFVLQLMEGGVEAAGGYLIQSSAYLGT